jgi:hypothetical protein
MKIIHAFLCLVTLLAGLMAGKWISGEAVARVEAARAWKQHDVEGSFQALTRLAKTSPARAFELVLTWEGDESSGQGLLLRLIKEFPYAGAELMEVFLKHPEHHHDYGVGDMAFSSCARVAPERAWQAMMEDAVRFMPAFLPAIARGMVQKDPLTALTYVEKIQCPTHRDSFVHELIQEWSSNDGEGLLTWLRAQPDSKKLTRHVAWFQLKISSPARLDDIAALLPEGGMVGGAFSYWMSRSEAEGAWMQHTDWLLALPAGEVRTRLCTAAAQGLVNLDPEEAMKLLPEIKNTAVHRRVVCVVSAFRAAASPQEGLAFANALTDADEKHRAKNDVYFTWAENDPEGAAKYATTSDDKDAKIMLSYVGYQWARIDPENACRFALEHETKDEGNHWKRSAMLKSTVNTWANTEPVAAAGWVKTLPEGGQRDAACSGLASSLAHRLPEESLKWAQDIKDAEMRKQSLQMCLMSWLHKDSEKPVKWLTEASLDEETRKAISTWLKPHMEVAQSGKIIGGGRFNSDGISIFN